MRIVLVEPQTEGNIGSVCRAMKTMGLNELAIVRGRDYDEDKVCTLALHAKDIWHQALRFDGLEEALSDCCLSAGISRRRGKNRKYFSILPEEFARQALERKSETVAAVFGRESSGLSDKELAQCNLAVHIPTSPEFPSLNLSHAVQIICYELFRAKKQSSVSFSPVALSDIERLSTTVVENFDKIGFFKQDEKEEVRRFYRDIFARAGLSTKETQRLEKMFTKMSGIKIHKTPNT